MIKRVIKRDGRKEKFDPTKIFNAILKTTSQVYPQKAEEIAKKINQKVLELLKKYKKDTIHIEEIQDKIEETLMKNDFSQIARVYILYRKFREEIRLLKDEIGIKDELKLSLNAISILKERYLLKDENGNICETPLELFERVASFVSQAEKIFSSKKENYWRDKFFEKLISLEFLPNSPTLMNAGTPLGQLSACFVLPVEDSIPAIFDTLKAMALIHQSGGGTGFSFSHLRPKGDCVSSTKGVASGPVSFMHIFDTATKVILQGGKRRGANMGVLRVNHPDIVEFVEAKLKEGVLENFNLSVGITDEFVQAIKKNDYITLINPRTNKSTTKLKAKTLFSLISLSAYHCGDPGLIFLDQINRKHPLKNLGKIEATNPCGEVPLLSYESCNLGSINLAKFAKNKKVDWPKLKETIKTGIRFLDNVIELNKYPLKEIEEITKKNRKIGLGVMGFADMLIKLRIPYDSEEAVKFSRKLMKFIRQCSLEASLELSKERGVFPNWKYSVYKKKNLPLRNATLNSIAPTGSISIIAGCSSGIEPLFALSYTRRFLERMGYFETTPLLEEVAREEGIYSKKLIKRLKGEVSLRNLKGIPKILKRLFPTTFDILPLNHLKIQAAFQEFTDNAVSKTINLPSQTSPQRIQKIYYLAYQFKLKGITVYRYGSKKEQVLLKEEFPKEVILESDSGGCLHRICFL
jgi:ribonucleoside-diphosphate reductase alpha chain